MSRIIYWQPRISALRSTFSYSNSISLDIYLPPTCIFFSTCISVLCDEVHFIVIPQILLGSRLVVYFKMFKWDGKYKAIRIYYKSLNIIL